MLRIVFAFLIFPLCVFSQTHASNGHLYRTSLRHIESSGIGYDDGYSTLEMFLSTDPAQRKFTSFLDTRGHIFNDGKWAANVGIGLRTIYGQRVYGVNTYYDYRNATHLNSNQIGVGLESLGKRYDFRINGYLPFGRSTSAPYDSTFGTFSGNFLLLSQQYQSAMRGCNAEMGVHLGRSRFFDLYAAAGPYYFTGKFTRPSWGGKARIAGVFNNIFTLELSDSYDRTFHNNFQAQFSLNYFFGPSQRNRGCECSSATGLCYQMMQRVERQEIIVIDNQRANSPAINPLTGQPFFFVFVDNTSSSDGTYESPYHTLIQAQDNSSPNDIIYVFPGDGTTTGMDSGITLQANQKFWGSGVAHLIQTKQGPISIPAQSTTFPVITNVNVDTDGNAITLATNNAISGFIIDSTLNDGIFGVNAQNLDVSWCTFRNNTTFAIEASFLTDTTITLTDNQLLNNVNGINLNLSGPSNVICSHNTFKNQTSVSSTPIEIAANNNSLVVGIEDNLFDNNTTGGIRFNLDNVIDADINIANNRITFNGTGSQSSLASSIVLIQNGTIGNCIISINDNFISNNDSNALYMHTSGAFTNLELTANANTISNNGGSGFVLATPTETLNFVASENTITQCNDNGIAIIGSGLTANGTVDISGNSITNIGNGSNGIAVNQDFTSLNLSITSNEISTCEGTGIISYAPTGITNLALTISDNTIIDCQNLSSNAASGLDIEQYTHFEGDIISNTLSGNTGTAVYIGSTLPAPEACLNLSGNENSSDYLLVNPVDGVFNLSPCNVESVNVGTINQGGTITLIQSCSNPAPCPP